MCFRASVCRAPRWKTISAGGRVCWACLTRAECGTSDPLHPPHAPSPSAPSRTGVRQRSRVSVVWLKRLVVKAAFTDLWFRLQFPLLHNCFLFWPEYHRRRVRADGASVGCSEPLRINMDGDWTNLLCVTFSVSQSDFPAACRVTFSCSLLFFY